MKRRVAAGLSVMALMVGHPATAQTRDDFMLDHAEYSEDSGQHVFTGVPLAIEKEWEGNVDLFGIASFALDRRHLIEQIGDLAPSQGSANFLIRLGFRQRKDGGDMIACKVLETSAALPDDAGERVCRALQTMELAGLRTRRGFEWGAQTAYLTIDLALYRAPEILRPIAQARKRDGIAIKAAIPAIRTAVEGMPTCSVPDQRIEWDEIQQVCDIFEAQLERSSGTASDGTAIGDWDWGQIYLKRDPERSKTRVMIDHLPVGPSRYNKPKYDAFELDPALELTDALGSFRLSIGAVEYPERAKRTDVRGKTTIILWPRVGNGQRTRCRVEASSGSSVLDNESCELAIRRSMWAWNADATRFEGGWRRVVINWSLEATKP